MTAHTPVPITPVSDIEARRAAVWSLLKPQAEALPGPFVSLGTHCYTAWILKNLELKTASFPFDWLVSNPGAVLHILQDDFRTFLDASHYRQIAAGEPGGKHGHEVDHTYYREHHGVYSMFNHHNTLIPEGFDYINRAVGRFRELQSATFLMIANYPVDEPYVRSLEAALRVHVARSTLHVFRIGHASEAPASVTERISEHATLTSYTPISALQGLGFADPADDAVFCPLLLKTISSQPL